MYYTLLAYCHDLAHGTVSFTGDWAQGDNSKQYMYLIYLLKWVFFIDICQKASGNVMWQMEDRHRMTNTRVHLKIVL